MKRELHVVIERDGAGCLVASVLELPGCHTQARSMDQLLARIHGAAELCLEMEEAEGEGDRSEFVGVQRMAVEALVSSRR